MNKLRQYCKDKKITSTNYPSYIEIRVNGNLAHNSLCANSPCGVIPIPYNPQSEEWWIEQIKKVIGEETK